jgi:glucose/arabinose dehydrogenase
MMKLACAACFALSLSIGMAHAASADCQAASTRLLDHLDKGDYAGATADFNDKMKAAETTDKLAALWQSMPLQLGAPGAREPAQVSAVPNYVVVVTALHYGPGMIDAQVACDADGKIGGFYIRPHR